MKAKPSPPKPVWQNPVKELLKKGQPAVGVVISVNSVEVAAQAAALGFDFLWLEMEHSPLSLETVRNIVLATRGLPGQCCAPFPDSAASAPSPAKENQIPTPPPGPPPQRY